MRPSTHRSSDPNGRGSEREAYVRAGVYRCSSPENLVSSSHAIRMTLCGNQPDRVEAVTATTPQVYTGQKTIGGAPAKRSAPLVRVGTELRFELIAKPALGSHVHGADSRRLLSTPSTRANYSVRFSQANGRSASWATFLLLLNSTCSAPRCPGTCARTAARVAGPPRRRTQAGDRSGEGQPGPFCY